ncbi:hypothetical protein ACOXDM_003080 [Proteus mirabilis]|uniref:hypothetical protein n=2 Tax=Proteus mirabilis TaxID=584 RepID=UPI0034E5ED3E
MASRHTPLDARSGRVSSFEMANQCRDFTNRPLSRACISKALCRDCTSAKSLTLPLVISQPLVPGVLYCTMRLPPA